MEEVWKPVVGWEGGYEVSNLGRIRSLPRTVMRGKHPYRWPGRMMKCWSDKDGYVNCTFQRQKERTSVKVHAAVAAAFIGPRPPGEEVRHLDGKRDNNVPGNLGYGTSAQNSADMIEHNNSTRGEKNTQAKLTAEKVIQIRRRFASKEATARELAAEYGINHNHVRSIATGKSWGWLNG